MSENSKFLDLDGLEYAIGKINENGGDGFYPFIDYIPSGLGASIFTDIASPFWLPAYANNQRSIKDDHTKAIDAGVFYNAGGLSHVEFTKCKQILGYTFISNFYYGSGYAQSASGCFEACGSLNYASFPKCEYIGDKTFRRCYSLTSTYFPEVRYIGVTAFSSCYNLTSISLPKVEYIGNSAFYSCSALSDIYMPNCKAIGYQAFYSTSLTNIDIPNIERLDSHALWGFSSLNLNAPKLQYLGSSNYFYLSSITIDINVLEHIEYNNLSKISPELSYTSLYLSRLRYAYDFPYCPNLTVLNAPNAYMELSSTQIKDSVFPKLTDLTMLGVRITSQNSNLFSTLDNVTLNGNPSSTFFSYLSNVKRVIINYSGNYLPVRQYEFRMPNLEYFEFENLVDIRSYGVFANCTNLKELSLPNLSIIQSEQTFTGCLALSSVTLPKLSWMYAYTFSGCTGLTDVDLPIVRDIASYTFAGCTNLKNVNIPNVVTISERGFQGCTALSELTLDLPTAINSGAFSGCTKLKKLTLKGSNFTTLNASASIVFNGCPIYTGGGSIYVPKSLYTSYRTSANWIQISTRFVSY